MCSYTKNRNAKRQATNLLPEAYRSHFYDSFGNKDAAAIGIRGADLFIICVV